MVKETIKVTKKKKGKKVKQVASEETEQPNQEDGDFDKLLKAAKEMGEKLFEDQARGPVKHVGGKLCHMKTIPNTCKAPYKNCHAYICGRDYGCGKGVCKRHCANHTGGTSYNKKKRRMEKKKDSFSLTDDKNFYCRDCEGKICCKQC